MWRKKIKIGFIEGSRTIDGTKLWWNNLSSCIKCCECNPCYHDMIWSVSLWWLTISCISHDHVTELCYTCHHLWSPSYCPSASAFTHFRINTDYQWKCENIKKAAQFIQYQYEIGRKKEVFTYFSVLFAYMYGCSNWIKYVVLPRNSSWQSVVMDVGHIAICLQRSGPNILTILAIKYNLK